MSGRALATLAASLAAAAVLVAVGDGALASPPLDPAEWPSWWGGRDAVTATMATARVATLATALYVAAASLLVLAVAGRRARLVRALVAPPLRRLLLAGALAVPPASGVAAAQPTTAPPTMVLLEDAPGPAAGPSTIPPPTMTLLDDQGPPRAAPTTSSSTTTTSTTTSTTSSTPPPTARPTAPASATTRIVGAGDHFWTVAEDVVAGHLGRPPADDEVAPYWRRLIEANRSVLADPANPDLLFPGQVITLPAP